MEVSDSSVVQCEENKAVPEKHRGRQYKSKEQLQGLEDFYTEHKYPNESLKAELAIKLDLTEKQVSGWFCHRRLKDKRLLAKGGELPTPPGKQDLSSVIIQDRASGLKQDSCSSTKQADYRRVDPREVDSQSQRYCNENLPVPELNFQRNIGDGMEMDDTSSESNSAPQVSFQPQKRSHLETTEYRPLNGIVQHSRGRAGPSGYLKIKGQTENAAITAVKRQLGRHYREDGPSLGIEFDPLPPEAFESPSNTIDDDAYGVMEPMGFNHQDVSGIHKRPGLTMMRNEGMYEAPDDIHLQKSNPDKFSFRQPKQKLPFPDPNSSFGNNSYSSYSNSRNATFQQKHDLPSMRSNPRLENRHSYAGKIASDSPSNTFLPDYDDVIPKHVRQREQFSSKPTPFVSRHKDPMYIEDEEFYPRGRPTSEHLDSTKLKMRPPNALKARKRGREQFLEEDYSFRSPTQDPALWNKQRKGPTEMRSTFSDDEAAERSSSME